MPKCNRCGHGGVIHYLDGDRIGVIQCSHDWRTDFALRTLPRFPKRAPLVFGEEANRV